MLLCSDVVEKRFSAGWLVVVVDCGTTILWLYRAARLSFDRPFLRLNILTSI